MRKLLTIFALLFGFLALSLATSVEVPESGAYCLIYYDEYTEDPQCETIIDEEGEEVEECSVESPLTLAAVLTAEENSFVQEDFSMASFNFFEDCNCVVKYFKGNTASGCSVRKEFTSEDYNVVATSEVVSWKPNSFAFECQF